MLGSGSPVRLVGGGSRRTAPRPQAPDLERAERIGEFWSYPQSRTFAELLIDCEEDRALRAVLVGMLRESDRGVWQQWRAAPQGEPASVGVGVLVKQVLQTERGGVEVGIFEENPGLGLLTARKVEYRL